MTRRGKITVKVTRRVEVTVRRTVTARPIGIGYSYPSLGGGRMARVVCDGCNIAVEGWVSSDDDPLWCPNCAEYIAIEG